MNTISINKLYSNVLIGTCLLLYNLDLYTYLVIFCLGSLRFGTHQFGIRQYVQIKFFVKLHMFMYIHIDRSRNSSVTEPPSTPVSGQDTPSLNLISSSDLKLKKLIRDKRKRKGRREENVKDLG